MGELEIKEIGAKCIRRGESPTAFCARRRCSPLLILFGCLFLTGASTKTLGQCPSTATCSSGEACGCIWEYFSESQTCSGGGEQWIGNWETYDTGGDNTTPVPCGYTYPCDCQGNCACSCSSDPDGQLVVDECTSGYYD